MRQVLCWLFLLSGPSLVFGWGGLNKEEKDWLKVVDFIITSDERRIFRKKLTNSYERQQFIELFWAKRDPDLTEPGNPFRDDYMARYDYVMTHYEKGRHKIPQDERSYIFLLLGKPDRNEPRIDITIMGNRFRNKIFQHRPELWTYKEPGHGYKRNKLKIQLLPTTVFGDYIAHTDNYSANWLRNLKYKFIKNPDLEVAPLESTLQATGAVDLAGSRTEPEELEEPEIPISRSEEAPSPDEAPEIAAEVDLSSSPTSAPEVDAPQTRAPVPPVQKTLSVPTPIAPVSENPAVNFDTSVGNPLEVAGALGYFKSGLDQVLVLGRVGLPAKNLDFDFVDNQFTAGFVLQYSILDSAGNTLRSDSFESAITVPAIESLEKKNTWFSKEFAAIMPPNRYRLRVQATSLKSGKTSYAEVSENVPPLDRSIGVTQLALMDPNVNPGSARFTVNGKPYSLLLGGRVASGDRVFPVLEILSQPGADTLDTVQIEAIKDGESVHTWVLYPEEMTLTDHGTVLVHPELRTQNLDIGSYSLRFEMELPSGDLVLSETQLTIEPRGNSR